MYPCVACIITDNSFCLLSNFVYFLFIHVTKGLCKNHGGFR